MGILNENSNDVIVQYDGRTKHLFVDIKSMSFYDR